jgi:hypothetical protein
MVDLISGVKFLVDTTYGPHMSITMVKIPGNTIYHAFASPT